MAPKQSISNSKWATPQNTDISSLSHPPHNVMPEVSATSASGTSNITPEREEDWKSFQEHKRMNFDPFKASFEAIKATLPSRANTPEERTIQGRAHSLAPSLQITGRVKPTDGVPRSSWSGWKGASAYEDEPLLISNQDRSTASPKSNTPIAPKSPTPALVASPPLKSSLPKENSMATSKWARPTPTTTVESPASKPSLAVEIARPRSKAASVEEPWLRPNPSHPTPSTTVQSLASEPSYPVETAKTKSKATSVEAPWLRSTPFTAPPTQTSRLSAQGTRASSADTEFEPQPASRKDSKFNTPIPSPIESATEFDSTEEQELVQARLAKLEEKIGVPAVLYAISKLYHNGDGMELPPPIKAYVEQSTSRIAAHFNLSPSPTTSQQTQSLESSDASNQLATSSDIEQTMATKFKNVQSKLSDDTLMNMHKILSSDTAEVGSISSSRSKLNLKPFTSVPALPKKLEDENAQVLDRLGRPAVPKGQYKIFVPDEVDDEHSRIAQESFSPNLEQRRKEIRASGIYGPHTQGRSEGILSDNTIFGGPFFMAGVICGLPKVGNKFPNSISDTKK